MDTSAATLLMILAVCLPFMGVAIFAAIRIWIYERAEYADYVLDDMEWEAQTVQDRHYRSRPSRPDTLLYWPIADYRRRAQGRRVRLITLLERQLQQEQQRMRS